MTASTPMLMLRGSAISLLLLLCSCGERETPEPLPPADPPASAIPAPGTPVAIDTSQPRELTPEEQNQVIEGVLQARAKQQAEGLGAGSVKVNGAWPYNGYSELAPDPAAAIAARLVAVDVTISGQTPFFDIDDIEIVDGATLVSYGSDPHATPLSSEGGLLAPDEPIPQAPAASRWLLIYAFPKASSSFSLYYWGKALTPKPVEFGKSGLSLPYPAKE